MEDCPHPQRQNRRMATADGTFFDWVTWCPRCHHAWAKDGRRWVEDPDLPWPRQLVPVR